MTLLTCRRLLRGPLVVKGTPEKDGQVAKISLKAAWKQGGDAAHKGQPLTANPFPQESHLYESWNGGWRMADEDRRDRSAVWTGSARLNPDAAKSR